MITRALFATFASVGAASVLAGSALGAVTASVTCVAPQADGTGFRAYWGFGNDGAADEVIPIGTRNRFSSGATDRGQGTLFARNADVPGFGDDRTHLRVAVNAGGGTAFPSFPGWRLGLTGTPAPVTPTADSPRCDFDLQGAALTADRAEARPGQDIAWGVAVKNDGGTPLPVTQVSMATTGITEILPPAVAPDELMPGETLVYPARSRVTPEDCFGTAVATVNLSFGTGIVQTPETDLSNNGLRAEVPVVCLVDLQVTSEADAPSYAPGQTASFTVTVVNAGEAAIPSSALRVAHSRAADLTPVEPLPDVIAPGARVRFRGTAGTTGAACGGLPSTATVALEDGTGRLVDGVLNNNRWESSVLISCGGSTAPPVTTTAAPRLAVTILGPRRARIGTRATLTVRVRNRGNRVARGLVASLALPKGSVLAQRLGRLDVRTGNLLHRRIPTLRPGATWTTRVRVRFSRARGTTRVFSVRADATNSAARSARRVVVITR